MLGWPFNFKRKKKRHTVLKFENITVINAQSSLDKKWVLIEPNGNLHYGFIDAGLLNYPTYDYETWHIPNFYDFKVKTSSENHIKIVISNYSGPINPWANSLGYEIKGPFIFNSYFSFGVSDIQILEKLIYQ